MSFDYIESFDRLLIFIGDRQQANIVTLSGYVSVNALELSVAEVISSPDISFLLQLVEDMEANELVERLPPIKGDILAFLKLNLKGWQRYREIKKLGSNENLAFMAMAFSGEPYNSVYAEHIKPAVEQTGFKLINVAEDKKTGTIDDKIRLNIQLSKFVIADLSSGNRGAYWEAGYAEALKKPVIYIINSAVWDDSNSRGEYVHFDTEHQTIYQWDKANIEKFTEELKAAIRVNNESAKMTDS